MQHVLLLWQTSKSASETCVKFLQNPIESDLRVVEVSISLIPNPKESMDGRREPANFSLRFAKSIKTGISLAD